MATTTLCTTSNTVGAKIAKLLEKGSVISPFSLAYLLSIVQLAATGNTKNQITQLLEAEGTHTDLAKTATVFDNDIVKIANIAIVNKNIPIKSEFLAMLNELALVSNEDFGAVDSVVKKFNSFIEAKTTHIRDLLKPDMVHADSVMFVANTLFFKAKWQTPFESFGKAGRSFHNFESEDEMEFMSQETAMPYFEDDDVQLVEILCKNTDYCMGFIVPKTHKYGDFGKFKKTDQAKLEKFRDFSLLHQYAYRPSSYPSQRVKLQVPKFSQRKKHNLIPMMQAAGVTDLFDPKCSSLGGMVEGNRVYVDTMIQEAVIIVDEEGVEASAASLGGFRLECCYQHVNVYARHPFAYYIKHKPTNTVLYVGDLQ